jgi:hypothetical protein
LRTAASFRLGFDGLCGRTGKITVAKISISRAEPDLRRPVAAPSGNDRYLRTPAIAGQSNGRGPCGRKGSGQRRGPLLGPSAVPVHPSLMRRFQSRLQGHLRLKTVSRFPPCHLRQSGSCATHHLWRYASGTTECQARHRQPSATCARKSVPTARGLHVVSPPGFARLLGSPGTGVVMGRGGGISFGGQKKTSSLDCVATPDRGKPAVEQRASKLA